jgi:hypothetical protein
MLDDAFLWTVFFRGDQGYRWYSTGFGEKRRYRRVGLVGPGAQGGADGSGRQSWWSRRSHRSVPPKVWQYHRYPLYLLEPIILSQ